MVSSTTSRPERVASSATPSAESSSYPSIGSKKYWPSWALAALAPKFHALTKSWAVIGVEPSEKVRPSLIVMVQFWLSSDSIDYAMSFSAVPSAV